MATRSPASRLPTAAAARFVEGCVSRGDFVGFPRVASEIVECQRPWPPCPRTIQSLIEGLKPEASYFFTDDGKRTALFVFIMQETSQIPPIVEPLFMGMNAAVTLSPVMNAEELQKGLAEWAKLR